MHRALILIPLLAIVLGGLFFALRPDSPSAEPQARTFDLRLEGGAMTPEDIEVREGDRVKLRIESDSPAEFHLHGYDLEREVEPGESATLSFTADITGRFDIEGHMGGSGGHGGSHADEEGHSRSDEGGHSHEHEEGDHGHADANDHSHTGETVTGTFTVLPR